MSEIRNDIELYSAFPEANRLKIAIPKEMFLNSGNMEPAESGKFERRFKSAVLQYVFRRNQGDFPNMSGKDSGDEFHILEAEVLLRYQDWYFCFVSSEGNMILFTKKKITMDTPPLSTVVPML